MVVEKENNMGVLAAMGATPRLIEGIFANQGWLITSVGGFIGLAAGSLLTLGQEHFGWIKLSSANPAMMAVDHYPVALRLSDLIAAGVHGVRLAVVRIWADQQIAIYISTQGYIVF